MIDDVDILVSVEDQGVVPAGQFEEALTGGGGQTVERLA